MPTRIVYQEELAKLNFDVIRMGSLLEEAIDMVISALRKLDISLAREIIAGDDRIDRLEHDIEQYCITLVAKQQPVATDLRRVTSIMRIIADLERIADHCSDISEYIIRLAGESDIPMPEHVIEMIEVMKKMVADTIDSFIDSDEEKARSVIASDDIVDDYFEKIMDELCVSMKRDADKVKQYAEYLMIIKYIERMADHSTNVAGWVLFIVKGDLPL